MSKKREQKSILQQQADNLRQLKETITQFEVMEIDFARDVERLEIELMQARTNFVDTQAILKERRDKLAREANNMHTLIEHATQGVRGYRCN